MKKAILWLLFTIAAASAWEDDDYDNDDGICPLAVCHGIYVDTQYDIHHCGECDIKCFPNQICINGICTCPNNNNACGATCTACPTGQHCESFDDDYQCVCGNTVGSCGAPGSCSACTGATPDCINGACTCLNNNNACGVDCIACPTGQHCESLDSGTIYQCVCDNTVGSCGSPGSCISCTGPNQICDSTTGNCICPNTQTACGLNGACTDCTLNGTSLNSVCSDGICVCPNTDRACSSVTNCGACGGATPNCFEGTCICPNTPTQCQTGPNGSCTSCGVNQICVNSICGCCTTSGGITSCTQCSTGSTGCTASGLCNALGCAVMNTANVVRFADRSTAPGTRASCLSTCRAFLGMAFSYYSLASSSDSEFPYACFCYNSAYVFDPAAPGDDSCPTVINGSNYGTYGASYGPPGTEYVYIF